MTLSARNRVLLAGIIIAALFFLVAVISVLTAFARGVTMSELVIEGVQYWWMTYREYVGGSGLWIPWVLIGVTTVSVVSGYLLRQFFRKTVSYEIFFFIIFLLSISVDGVRAGQLLFAIWKIPPYFGMILTRINYLGHFMGLFSLFASSLYAMNIQYQKLGTILGLAVFLAFVLSASLPVDSSELYQSLLYKVGFEKGLLIVFVGFELFTLLNYLQAAIVRGSSEYFLIPAAVFMVIAGRELLFFLGSPVTVVIGGVLLVGGTVLYGKRLHALYLWA